MSEDSRRGWGAGGHLLPYLVSGIALFQSFSISFLISPAHCPLPPGRSPCSLPCHSKLLGILPGFPLQYPPLVAYIPATPKASSPNSPSLSVPLNPCTHWSKPRRPFPPGKFPLTLLSSVKSHSPSPLYLLFQDVYVLGHHCLIMRLLPSLGCELPEGRASAIPMSLFRVLSTRSDLGSALGRFVE